MTALQRISRRVGRKAAYRIATSDGLERAAMATGFTRRLAFRHARRYVAGLDEDAALAVVRRLRATGITASVDLFGEDVEDAAVADAVVERYLGLATMLAAEPGAYVSLDCSH